MSENDTPATLGAPVPHPLATELAALITTGSRVLVVGVGSGRSIPCLLEAGARVDALEDDVERARAALGRFATETRVRIARGRYGGPIPFTGGFDAALSTHALQHGSLAGIAAAVAAIRSRLVSGAPFYATFGSRRDPRFASGHRLDQNVTVPLAGSERGVPHVYLDESELRRLLEGFEIESAVEASAAETAGRWAHSDDEAASLVHWFVRARRSVPR